MLPTEIRQHLEDHYGTLNNYQPASRGCINHGAVCSFAQQHLFIKWNDVNSFMAMFEAEANGLNELRKSRFKIPEVLGLFSTDQFTCLVMEAIISSTPSANYWHTAGRQLAQMHQLTAEIYGLDGLTTTRQSLQR